MTKIYRVQMNAKGMPNFATAEEVADRPKGKWIIHKAPTDEYCSLIECPFCGEELVGEAHEHNFCPNCGADMRQTENEDV